jgi:hypothetical protein
MLHNPRVALEFMTKAGAYTRVVDIEMIDGMPSEVMLCRIAPLHISCSWVETSPEPKAHEPVTEMLRPALRHNCYLP